MIDVIVVGGSYAGLAAALQLGRARRTVLVVDGGQRRNRFAAAAHGFLGQDGVSPGEIAARARAEVLAYPTVAWRDGLVTGVRRVESGFEVQVGEDAVRGRRLIVAVGVVDELPDVAGLAERWGRSVFHCPYCHGYELDRGDLGVLATGPMAAHQAPLVAQWAGEGRMTLFLNGAWEPDEEQRGDLAARGVRVEREAVAAVAGDGPGCEVRLRDGRVVGLAGLFVASRTSPPAGLVEALGCELAEGPVGTYLRTDDMKATTVAGVFACGDAALPMGSVSFAVADGVRAGIGAHASLVFSG